MKIAMQLFTELGGFSNPHDSESDVFRGTIAECLDEMRAWRDLHLQGYALEAIVPAISANCFYGNTIGEYPDFQIVLGKRGAPIVSRC